MMKKSLWYAVLLSAGTLLGAGAVQADEQLAMQKGCMACHKIDTKVVGPAYKDVAEKYKGQEGAVEELVKKVKEGGSGVWGPVPMPPNAAVSEEDIETLVKWIMAMAEDGEADATEAAAESEEAPAEEESGEQ